MNDDRICGGMSPYEYSLLYDDITIRYTYRMAVSDDKSHTMTPNNVHIIITQEAYIIVSHVDAT